MKTGKYRFSCSLIVQILLAAAVFISMAVVGYSFMRSQINLRSSDLYKLRIFLIIASASLTLFMCAILIHADRLRVRAQRRLYAQTEYARELSATLTSIIKSPEVTAGHIETAGEVITVKACKALTTHRIGIWKLSDDEAALRSIIYYDSKSMEHSVQPDVCLLKCPEYMESLRNERLVVIDDISKPNPLSAIINDYDPDICATIDAPISVGGKLAGVICVEQNRCAQFPNKREWTIEEQTFVSSLADTMRMAIGISKRRSLTARIEEMLDNLPGMVYRRYTDDSRLSFVSKGCIELCGYTPEEIADGEGIHFHQLIHPDDIISAQRRGEEALATGLPLEYTYRIITKDGCVKWIWESSRVIERDANGAPYLIEGFCSDITERHQFEAEREAHKRVAAMTDTSPLTCTMWTKEGIPFDCNEEVLKLLDVGSKEEYLENFFEYVPEIQENGRKSGEYAMEKLKEAFETGKAVFESNYMKKDGTLIPHEVTLSRIEFINDYVVVGYGRDLREHKKMLAALVEAKQLAEQNDRAKSVFLAGMSHEIRSPLNVILGMAEIQLQNNLLPPEVAEALNLIYDSGSLLINIINDILDFSKIEAGKLEVTPAEYHIPSLINDTVQLMLLRYESKPIGFSLDIGDDMPLCLFGDELRIKQIIVNILSNAFKYTDAGEVALSVIVKENPDTRGKENVDLIISVSDTGQGISEENLSRLFEEYARFNMEKNRTVVGTGLGLNITKKLIDIMGGEIKVESKVGAGSTFTVRLPQLRSGTAKCGKELIQQLRQFRFRGMSKAQKTLISRDYMPYGKVLIVDDIMSNLLVAKGLLVPYGLRLETAASGTEAIEKIKAGNEYDIVFMDHMMPDIDGMEATKIIRGLGYPGTIIALTANAVSGQAETFLACGFDAFISKPVDSRELDIHLNRFIRDKYPADVIQNARREKAELCNAGAASNAVTVDPEMRKAFLADAEAALNTLELLSAGDTNEAGLKLFTTTVHGIKSALANIGEAELSKTAKRLEAAARAQNTQLIRAECPQFLSSLRDAAARYSLGKHDRDHAVIIEDKALLNEKLLFIKDACASMNGEKAEAALSELRLRKWSKATEKALDTISAHLLHSTFRNAAAFIESLPDYIVN